jgi:hypothetical protein
VLDGWPWFDLFRTSVATFVDALPIEDDDLVALDSDLRAPVLDVLKGFWDHPTDDEVATWGRFVFEDDILGTSHNHLAQPYRWSEIVGKVRTGEPPRNRVWPAGCARVSPIPVRAAVALFWAARDTPRHELVPQRARQLVQQARVRRATRPRR